MAMEYYTVIKSTGDDIYVLLWRDPGTKTVIYRVLPYIFIFAYK